MQTLHTSNDTTPQDPGHPPVFDNLQAGARRFGYTVAAAINAVLLFIAVNLTDLGWFGFITDEWDGVVRPLAIALGAALVANIAYVIYDGKTFKSTVQLLLAALNIWATLRVLDVFPFDFSVHPVDWSPLVRLLLIVAIVGTVVGAIVEVVRLTRRALSS